jgi:hypothetical protein
MGFLSADFGVERDLGQSGRIASVDQTDARNAPADNLVIDQLGWIECLASGR